MPVKSSDLTPVDQWEYGACDILLDRLCGRLRARIYGVLWTRDCLADKEGLRLARRDTREGQGGVEIDEVSEGEGDGKER